MSSVLVFSERKDLTLELLAGGREMAAGRGATLAVALAGEEAAGWADECFAHGATIAYLARDAALTSYQADTYAEALAQMARQAGADLILIGSTRRGRTLAPRVAQKLDAGCVTNAKTLELQDGRLLTKRVAFGGNTLKEEAIITPIQVIAVVPGTFDTTPGGGGGQTVVELAVELKPSRATTVERHQKATGAVNVEQAPRLVCMGRGVREQGDIELIERLANALRGVVVGTRPLAYELEWVSEDRMIGISGKTVRPDLYMAVGVSGQIQHTVSIRDTKIIVAINSDKNAPIFEMADYGIVGDLYEIVPRLIEELQRE